MGTDNAVEVHVDRVTKLYGDFPAVRDVSLDIRGGEFFTLLGPSGCGKTTTLRMVAGLIRPTSGRVLIGDTDVTFTPPHSRNAAMVFQNYALFPHMSVFENIAFGLRVRRMNAAALKARLGEVIEIVGLEKLEARYPRELSGGQQQRVALARALAIRPRVLLLDEPLSNLDAKLRERMSIEIRDLQHRLGLTAIYVTHDQSEALAISDRVAVMSAGVVEQIGTPAEIYASPQSRFVADFVGKTNLLEVTLGANGVGVTERGLPVKIGGCENLEHGTQATLVIRPESLRIWRVGSAVAPDGANTFTGVISRIVYLGAVVRLNVLAEPVNEDILVEVGGGSFDITLREGDRVTVSWSCEAARLIAHPPGSSANSGPAH